MTNCIVIDVDGEPVRVQLARGASLTPEEIEAFKELVRSARNMHEAKLAAVETKKRKIRIVRKK